MRFYLIKFNQQLNLTTLPKNLQRRTPQNLPNITQANPNTKREIRGRKTKNGISYGVKGSTNTNNAKKNKQEPPLLQYHLLPN